MDWIKEHKTLATILGGAGVGALGLGYMLWSSYSSYDEALSSYDSTVKKLARLEGAPLYPNAENLAKKSSQVEAFRAEVDKLQKTLVNLQPKIEPISDTAFQAKLKTMMSETRKKAAVGQQVNEIIDPAKKNENSMLPKDFSFGFETYVNTLPSADVVNDLNDYLDAVNGVVQLALDNGVKKITALDRTPLAKEKGSASAKAPEAASADSFIQGNAAKDKAPAVVVAEAIEARTLKMTIVGDQPAIQAVINGLASASVMHHFTVLKLIRIENDKLTGPARGMAVPSAAPASGTSVVNDPTAEPQPVDPNAPPTPAGPEVIAAPKPLPDDAVVVMGSENLHVHLEIDIMNYSAPATASDGK